MRPSDSTHCSTTSWPPSSAKAAEKIDEPTNSQHTIADVLAVRNTDSLTVAAELELERREHAPYRAVATIVTQPTHIGGPLSSTSNLSSRNHTTETLTSEPQRHPLPQELRAALVRQRDERVDRGQDEAAQRAHRRRLGGRGEPEDDRAEHGEDQHREREERRQQHLEDYEPGEGEHRVEERPAPACRRPATIQKPVGAGTRCHSTGAARQPAWRRGGARAPSACRRAAAPGRSRRRQRGVSRRRLLQPALRSAGGSCRPGGSALPLGCRLPPVARTASPTCRSPRRAWSARARSGPSAPRTRWPAAASPASSRTMRDVGTCRVAAPLERRARSAGSTLRRWPSP